MPRDRAAAPAMLGDEVALDSGVYPHIADAILSALIANLAASHSSRARRTLFALRRVNCATRDRVDARLAYRIAVDSPSLHPAFTGLALGEVLSVKRPPKRRRVEPSTRVLRSRRGVLPPPSPLDSMCIMDRNRRACSLLQHTRVLDFGPMRQLELWDTLAKRESRAALFPNLQAVRVTGDNRRILPPGRLLPPAVWFQHLDVAPTGFAAHYRCFPVPTPRLVWSVSYHRQDTALHYRRGGAAWVEPFYATDQTSEFVFLFVPARGRCLRLRDGGHVVPPRAPGFVWGDYRVPSGALGVLEDVVFHMGPELERTHVLAGLEGLPPQALGLEPGAGREAVFTAVRAGIRAALLARRDDARDRVVHPDLWPESVVDACVDRVRIITLDEYQAEVSEEQFAWETVVDL